MPRRISEAAPREELQALASQLATALLPHKPLFDRLQAIDGQLEAQRKPDLAAEHRLDGQAVEELEEDRAALDAKLRRRNFYSTRLQFDRVIALLERQQVQDEEDDAAEVRSTSEKDAMDALSEAMTTGDQDLIALRRSQLWDLTHRPVAKPSASHKALRRDREARERASEEKRRSQSGTYNL